MESTIRKWGNSPALRLPSALLNEAGLGIDQRVRVSVVEGAIRIEQLRRKPVYRLNDLLAKAAHATPHDEVVWGAPRGNEAW